MADVSGKGIPASLLMARLSADVRNCLASEPTPAAAVAQVNSAFIAAGWEDRFVTLLLAVLDPLRHELTLVDAGHPPAYLCQNGEFAPGKGGETSELFRWDRGRLIEAIGPDDVRLPLGVAENTEYSQVSYKLEPGDWLAMYTDGFSEATNKNDELFGLERLSKQMGVPPAGVAAQGQDILRSVKEFVGEHPQADDMCLVCLGRVK